MGGKRLGRPRESWLGSDDSERFAAAMMKCEHGDPSFCSQDEACNRGGECFRSERVECEPCGGTGSVSARAFYAREA